MKNKFHLQRKCLTRFKKHKTMDQHIGSCLAILMTTKQLFVFNIYYTNIDCS